MMTTAVELPTWDLSPFFPSIDSPEFTNEMNSVRQEIADLAHTFHQTQNDPAVTTFDRTLRAYNELKDRVALLGAYVVGLMTCDTRDEKVQAILTEVELIDTELTKFFRGFERWIGFVGRDALIPGSALAEQHSYAIQKAIISARHQLSPKEEELAADMNTCCGMAWGRLHSNVGSQMMVSVALPSGTQNMPMSAVRNLAYEADAATRKAGYEAELAAWKTVETPMAASMNGIKGQVSLLCKKRGWATPLEESLHPYNIDAQTLEAMLFAAGESFPMFRRYLKAKAKLLGKQSLPFYDLFAPVHTKEKWTYERAEHFVVEQFTKYSEKMGEFAKRNFRENWIDAGPRPGKVDGAYCCPFRNDESRIFMNFKPSFGGVATLAHELGHGYHCLCLNGRTAWQRETPSTLAETASIFCEIIAKEAAIADSASEERLALLEASLMGSCQVVVDISSRYIFEKSVFERRSNRELSASELCDLMVSAQKQTYGDGLDLDHLHPYMWAVKPHYYSTESFYNYPYMFGHLFSVGLYAEYKRNPDGFQARYDDLLSSTGLADAATLGERFGIDIRTPEFWKRSLDKIGEHVDEFERLVNQA